ncbi:MAG: hypothetical protein LIO69_06120 [Oscillospiraceae bacterium]|nr:hypothetical protein [Oscillospiraceae bacterium]
MKYGFDVLISESRLAFDRAADQANRAYNVSKAYVEKAQLRAKLRDKYCELGKLCYDLKEKDADVGGEIKLVTKEIKMLETQLEYAGEAAGKPKICDFCGTKNPAESCYCSRCGEKL